MNRAAGVRVGIDIGGTFIKYGLLRHGKILTSYQVATPERSTPAVLQKLLIQQVHRLAHHTSAKIQGVGIGIPGLVEYPAGVVRSCVNLKGWVSVPLRGLLERQLHLPVRVDNDVNAMTLAEWTYGAGRGVSNLVCLTLGTGVGGGLVLDGKMYRGAIGAAGEVGHIPLAEDGPRCPCGGRGCLEQYVGNRQIIRWVRQQLRRRIKSRIPKLVEGRLDRLEPQIIDQACRLNDRLGIEAWRRTGFFLGLALAGVVNLLNPDRIVIGGGVAKAGRWIFEPLRATLRTRAMRGVGHVPVVPARLGGSAGLIGASLLLEDSS